MAQAAKTYFAMQRGLNTEAPLINFPDGFTTDEQNYELTIKGERRRRLGLGIETDGEAIAIPSYVQGDVIRSFDWENVAGIPTINMIVVQVGYNLYIMDDDNPCSPTLKTIVLDIRPYAVDEATDTQVSTWPLEAAFGRGHLFLFGKYTNPIYIEYNPDTATFALYQINITERDFVGATDAYDNTAQPTSATDSHTYNLKNRGWTDAMLSAFQSDQGKQPSKAMIPWLGLARTLTASDNYDQDGVRTFSPDKLVAELFQDASAPSGHFIKTPFSGTTANTDYDLGAGIAITSWVINEVPGPQTLTVTTSAPHGLAPTDEVFISELLGLYSTTDLYPITPDFYVNQLVTVTAVGGASEFSCVVEFPSAYPFEGWYIQYLQLGTVYTTFVSNPSGNVVDFRPKAGAFFAGRAWYAGIDTARLTGRIYFSQVIENDSQYAKCYQVADPTDERISDITPADGGVIVIPEASNVLKLVPYNSSLLVFASNGVWEVGPGDLGYFAASSYSVRKVSDSGTVSAGSVILMDNLPVYWGVTDIYGIAPNPQTGYLEVSNLSERVINTFYNAIPLATRRQSVGVYDDLSKRLIWLYSSSEDNNDYAYDRALIFDARMKAFIPFTFAYSDDDYLGGIMLLKEAGEVSKVKYLGVIDGELIVGEANNYDDYTDFGISEPECFLVTGFDSFRSPADFKYIPMVWVFSRKTEQGYDESFEPIRPSSTRMQARWEWADAASAGRWGREQEVYRHQRVYTPVDSSDTFDDGVPVVVTKNKLRGKGRVLQLKFTAGSGSDSFLMGWKTNFSQVEG